MRYIGYLHDGRPGDNGTDLRTYASLTEARIDFAREARKAQAPDDAYMTLYGFRDGAEYDRAWADAQDFRTTGCPFDCADYWLSIGPRGGVVSEHG